MSLDKKVIKDFVAAVNKKEETKTPTILTGTVHREGGTVSVKIDGSESLTPVSTVINVEDGERVTLTIENHKAMITGNLSSPAARTKEVEGLKEVVTDKVDTAQLKAIKAEVGEISGDVANFKETTTEKLTAQDAKIKKIDGDVANFKETTTEKLTAQDAKIKKIDGDVANFKETTTEKLTAQDAKIKKIDGDVANFKETTTEKLTAQDAKIKKIDGDVASFKETTTEKFKANEASIEDLKTGKLSAKDADLKYANIDFSNIGKTAMEYFYAQSGLIKDVTIGDATITGELVGVTISGDLIKGNTIVAEKLVIKGSDGLYYKLNTDGMTVEKEQTDYNSLNGQVIRAKSITATKIDVKDLVAFGATIGGFKIGQDSIYSGVKESVGNTTRGIYMDNDGQFVFGDASQYVKFYRVSEGKYKLAIAVEDLFIGSKSVAESIEDVKKTADNAASVASSASSAASTANSTANAAKSTAEGASKTASDAKSTADSASQVASNASSVAGTAKTTADNASKAASEANSTASTAKTTADQAKSTADTATKNLTALTAKVTEAETTIKKNKEEIELRAKKTEVTEAIDNIDIGGRNLFLNTGVELSTADYMLAGYKPAKDPLIEGKTYTVTICVTPAQGVEYINLYLSNGYRAQCQLFVDGTDKQIISTTFKAYYYTGREPDKDISHANANFYRFPNDGTVKTASTMHWIKIEEGNKPTDWTPAPEDYYTKTETEAKIKVEADKISSVVGKTDDLENRMSIVEQDSKSWSVTLDVANDAKKAAANAQATASSAKSTANSAKSTAESAVSTANQANSTASSAKSAADDAKTYTDAVSSQYGYRYKTDIIVYGSRTDYFYPVYLAFGEQNVSREILIERYYGEQAPDDWGYKNGVHKGALTLRIKANYGNWGGVEYKCEILDFAEAYEKMVGHIINNKFEGYAIAIWLRGGGSTGAIYHIFSDQPIVHDNSNSWHCAVPCIAYEGGKTVGWNGGTASNPSYSWVTDPPLSEPNTSALLKLRALDSANTARVEASEAAKTATNYMKFDNSGLTVGDLTKNTLGRNVNIDSSSVNIRNGSNVLASFAESLIEIGKNTNTATISFLNGIVKLIGQKQTIEGTTFYDAHLLSTNMMTLGTGSTDPSSDKVNALISLNGMSGEREVLASVTDTQGHSTLTVRDSSASLYSDGDAGYSSVNVITSKSTSQVEIHTNGSNGNRALINYSHAIQYYNNSTLLAAYNGQTPCLWDGFVWMRADQTATLSAPISQQPHGIIVIFALYDPTTGGVTNVMTNPYFVPKTAINYDYVFTMFWESGWKAGVKRVSVQDTQIVGNAQNDKATFKASSGITLDERWFVLRRVYGV